MVERILTVGGNQATRPISDFLLGRMGLGKEFYVDPAGGDDDRAGTTPETALKTIAEAYDRCTSGNNDIVRLIGNLTGASLTAALAWSKSYTHLVGLAPPGYNCRARIGNASASTDLATLLTVSGNGCVFENFRIGNYGSNAAALGNVVLTGSNNYFRGVHFFGPGHATPAGQVGARALTLSGAEENTFENCYIGGETIARTAASFILEITGASMRNIFKDCWLISAGDNATYKQVQIDNTATKFTLFDKCKFYNFSVNHATTMTEAFDIAVAATQDVIFIEPSLIGIAELDAGDEAGTWVVGPATAAASGIGVTPTT
jgi:hypothetical protein